MSAVVDAILISPPYMCLALAFGVLYGMLGIMDLTVSIRFAAAAYFGWCAYGLLGVYPACDPAVMIAAIGGSVTVSTACWLLLKPLNQQHALAGLVGSLGLVQVFQAGLQWAFGTSPKVYASYPVESGIELLGTTATLLQIISLGYAVVVVAATGCLLRFGGWGRRLQMVAADPELAEASFGIPRKQMEWTANLLIAVIIAPAAVFYASSHGVTPTTGVEMSLMAFVATIVAGRERMIGSVILTIILVVIRSVAIRWPWLDVTSAVIVGSLTFWFSAKLSNHAMSRLLCAIAAGSLAVCVAAAIRSRLNLAWTDAVIPSRFQEAVPYMFIVMALLGKPKGILAAIPQREM